MSRREPRRALVTGGAAGIGAAVVRALAAQGAHVTVADRADEPAQALAGEVGGEAWVVDLADTPALEQALAERAPDVDVLVCNAGVQRVAPLTQADPEDFRLVQRLMVEAPFLLTRAVLPGMYERGWGRIVHLSSAHGRRASPHKAAYVTAKHAIEGLSKVTALEGAEHGVTSNCVSPGYVRTALVEQQIADQATIHGVAPEAVVHDVLLAGTALKRLIEPEEVAGIVAYLASPAAGAVTGASWSVDGGWTAH